MGDLATDQDLESLVRDELFQPASPAATALSEEIRSRHGAAVAAVLFYGSCLRKRTNEGVLDFYIVVDSYPAAYSSRALAWGNALLPPNVFYLEIDTQIDSEPITLRAKYAVMSERDFARGAKPGGVRSGIWARFCQPALVVYSRDDAARSSMVRIVSDAILTAVTRTLPLLASEGGEQEDGGGNLTVRFTAETLWLRTLDETYKAELRPEPPGSVRGLYDAAPARYARMARAALTQLYGAANSQHDSDTQMLEVCLPANSQKAPPRGRNLRRLLAKFTYFFQLLKTAFTFGDWLPYALWKLERHSGTKVVLSERQRRHPFIWCWPIMLRILWRKDLR